MVELAASALDSELDAFLASNDLWGGSGSIADCHQWSLALAKPGLNGASSHRL
jgi:hypothetical protein